MARRSDHNRSELKAMAIEAGLEIIINDGLNALSTRKISKKIGYTVGTLYNIFKNLDDLIGQINLGTITKMVKAIMAQNSQNMTPEEELIQIGYNYISFAYNNFNRWNALFLHQIPEGSKLPDKNFEHFLELHSYLVRTILKIDKFSEDDAKLHSKILWSSVHGICILGITQKIQSDSEAHLHFMLKSLVNTQIIGMKQILSKRNS